MQIEITIIQPRHSPRSRPQSANPPFLRVAGSPVVEPAAFPLQAGEEVGAVRPKEGADVPYKREGGGVEEKEEEEGEFDWMQRLADSAWLSGM
jgi:hypothetical protein